MAGTHNTPWYRRTYRWGQTNLTEIDPTRYDAEWWRAYWRRTRIQGVIVNAGGIVTYYPTRFAEAHRALFLGERDLFGEIRAAARAEGLVVLARMDSNRVHRRFYLEHPDWIAVDAEGRPYRAGDLYITCIHSPYYEEFLPAVLREIIERYQPEGFTDNSWTGLDRNRICYCHYCAEGFRKATGMPLPKAKDWENRAYRQWIEWSYARRLEIWDLNNRTTREAGGADCLWVGMIGADPAGEGARFRDLKALAERAEILLLDSQARHSGGGFQSNAVAGKLLHGLLGWEKCIPESTAMYQAGRPTFRVAAKPAPEARLWAIAGFAGGIQPWWHHIGAYHEDRRQYRTAEPLFAWHAENEAYLIDRRPIAPVGIGWSQRTADFYGRDDAEQRVRLPWLGIVNALIRARIPFRPIHIDRVGEESEDISVLVLPNVGALSDAQCARIRQFVAAGGSLIATGETSLYDEWGDPRSDFALADLFGARHRGAHHGGSPGQRDAWDAWERHTYLRLHPELRARVDGPRSGDEPPVDGERHPVLAGFDETDLLPFGGRLEVVEPAATAEVALTFVPPFPIYPPETAWMETPRTHLPGLLLSERAGAGRIAYLPADIDRCYGRDYLPDHGRLLANLVRWASGEALPLVVEGPGFLDCHLYRQGDRLVLHVVNLTSAETWRAPIHELLPVGPVRIGVRLPRDMRPERVHCRVSGRTCQATLKDGWAHFELGSVLDHELVVIE
ncbi:MAG TPA: beta-galactosidase [Limnochordia bacterium]